MPIQLDDHVLRDLGLPASQQLPFAAPVNQGGFFFAHTVSENLRRQQNSSRPVRFSRVRSSQVKFYGSKSVLCQDRVAKLVGRHARRLAQSQWDKLVKRAIGQQPRGARTAGYPRSYRKGPHRSAAENRGRIPQIHGFKPETTQSHKSKETGLLNAAALARPKTREGGFVLANQQSSLRGQVILSKHCKSDKTLFSAEGRRLGSLLVA